MYIIIINEIMAIMSSNKIYIFNISVIKAKCPIKLNQKIKFDLL